MRPCDREHTFTLCRRTKRGEELFFGDLHVLQVCRVGTKGHQLSSFSTAFLVLGPLLLHTSESETQRVVFVSGLDYYPPHGIRAIGLEKSIVRFRLWRITHEHVLIRCMSFVVPEVISSTVGERIWRGLLSQLGASLSFD